MFFGRQQKQQKQPEQPSTLTLKAPEQVMTCLNRTLQVSEAVANSAGITGVVLFAALELDSNYIQRTAVMRTATLAYTETT